VDVDAVCGGEWGQSRNGFIRWGGSHQREGAVMGFVIPIALGA